MSGTITSLSQLTDTTPITEEEVDALIKNLSIKMYNIMNDGGHMAGIDTKTNGETGIEINISRTLEQMRKMMEFLTDLRTNPQKRGDFGIAFSQSFPEDYHAYVSDFATRFT